MEYGLFGKNIVMSEDTDATLSFGENEILSESVDILNERNVVRMDRNTQKKRLMTQATLLAAKEANDALYKRYVKSSKTKRQLRIQIQQKYESKGRQKVREFMQAQKEM